MMFVTSWLVVRNGILIVKNEKIKIEIVFLEVFRDHATELKMSDRRQNVAGFLTLWLGLYQQ